MKRFLLAASLVAITAAPALAQSAKTSGDAGFIDKVARDGQSEVEIGQLAAQKATSPQVKSFAQRLVTDHSKANQQLTQIAQRDGAEPPKAADKEHDALLAKLQKLNGPAFDRAFVQAQVEDHKKDVQYFQKEASAVKDPQLKSFIQQTLPVMEQHLQMAQQIESELSASGGTTRPMRQ
jgi:putative membrane protein